MSTEYAIKDANKKPVRILFTAILLMVLLWFEGIIVNIALKWFFPHSSDWFNGSSMCPGNAPLAITPSLFLTILLCLFCIPLLLCMGTAINYKLLKRLVWPAYIKQKKAVFLVAFAAVCVLSGFNYGGTPISSPQWGPQAGGYEWKWLGVRWENRGNDCN